MAPPDRLRPTAAELDGWLPQTQCTRCGYPRCRDYADALTQGEADINRCPPGGVTTIEALARLLDVPAKPLDPSCGTHNGRRVARVVEAHCIGCTLCIQACPVDAIVGASRCMHTVVAQWCTGCELCIAPCPVDCIELAPATGTGAPGGRWPEYAEDEVAAARERSERRLQRLAVKQRRSPRSATARHPTPPVLRAQIAAAVERVRRRRRARGL